MGVDFAQYVIHGVQLSFNEVKTIFPECKTDDGFELLEEKCKDLELDCIIDGMNGKYVFIGSILAESDYDLGFSSPMIVSLEPQQEEDISVALADLGVPLNKINYTWVFTHSY